ncbi:conserved membrane hypothetical protein [Candidatus Zixiibacteriota bacterium]|nr:conserved membrane hypothetical protein [candidate division Zixibacteria bacterium]
MNRFRCSLIAIFLIFIPSLSFASQFMTRKTVSIGREEQIDDDIYIFSNNSKLYGRVNGDFTAFCYDINTVGEIGGNANLFGYRVDLNGTVEKSARLFGNIVNINGQVTGNLLAFGNDLSLGDKSSISRDANFYGQRMTIDGTVNGNLTVDGSDVVISGTINGDVKAEVEKLVIIPPANIKGNLHYTSKTEAVIENGAVVQGQTDWKKPEKKKSEEGEGISAFTVLLRLILFIMALLVGLVLIFLFKNHTAQSVNQIDRKFWFTLAVGCLTFIVCTAVALFFMILIIGLPLGIFLFGFGIMLFYVGKIYVAIYIGRLILRAVNRARPFALALEFILGLIILTILFQLPYLGWLIYTLTFLLGMGAAVNGYIALCRNYRNNAAPATAPGEPQAL